MFKLSKIAKSLGFVFGVIVLSFSLGYVVLAWTEPSQVPPGCTSGTPGCDAPIHAGSTGQIKSGNLQVNALTTGTLSGNALLVPKGKVGIGTNSPSSRLDVAGDAGVFAAGCTITEVVGTNDATIAGGAGCDFDTLGVDDGSQLAVTGSFLDARLVTDKVSSTRVTLDFGVHWSGSAFTYRNNPQAIKTSGVLTTTGAVYFNGLNEGSVGLVMPNLDITVGGGFDGIFALRHDYDSTDAKNLVLIQSTADILPAFTINTKTGKAGLGMVYSNHQLELSTDDAAKPSGGTWAATSDMRLKKNIQPITGALDKIIKLQGVSFNWINPEEHGGLIDKQGGFIAQDVEKIFPEWVKAADSKEKDASLLNGDKAKNLSLPFEYDAYMVEAIKELKAENDSLKQENESLEKRIENLEKLVSSINAN